jgi:hypothetical protein
MEVQLPYQPLEPWLMIIYMVSSLDNHRLAYSRAFL